MLGMNLFEAIRGMHDGPSQVPSLYISSELLSLRSTSNNDSGNSFWIPQQIPLQFTAILISILGGIAADSNNLPRLGRRHCSETSLCVLCYVASTKGVGSVRPRTLLLLPTVTSSLKHAVQQGAIGGIP